MAYLGASSSKDLFPDNVVGEENVASLPKSETWILIGEPSKKHPPIHCKK